MTKIYGAHIFCRTCHAEPFPGDPASTRESFDIRRIAGDWFCERHRPKEKNVPKERILRAAPLVEVVIEFEAELTAQGAALADAIDGDGSAKEALEIFLQKIARGLLELKRAAAP